jgi:hypothetical protein
MSMFCGLDERIGDLSLIEKTSPLLPGSSDR